MKINYKNTALGLIDDPKNFAFGFPDPDITPQLTPKELREFGRSLIDTADTLKSLCGNNIQYVSESFWEAYANGRHKLKDLFDKEEITEGGILINSRPGITHTYYYFINAGLFNGKWSLQFLFIDFTKRPSMGDDGPNLDAFVSINIDEDGNIIGEKELLYGGYLREKRDVNFWVSLMVSFCLFKKYCDIETKEVSPQNRRAKVGNEKYVNETDKRIKILDCTWFTNLVVTGQFGVSGHLRWQPWGPNLSQRKLIWVADYVKDGYVRKAKMLNNE
jgi:hypothetical protein